MGIKHEETTAGQVPERPPRRLVLCFDGTGNRYHGDESDTNVVKIYEMLDRSDKEQFHYYQPGIGTFSTSCNCGGSGFFGGLKEKIDLIMDQAIGTSFEYHVCKGYEFLMRYYTPGDYIYIFGFSRGAYTARFLSEMISAVGLLSKGNEEMVRFAFSTFSEAQKAKGSLNPSAKDKARKTYMRKFKNTFCIPHVKVYFLGLFDCVNSVGQFEIPFSRQSYHYIGKPPARHIRHAVSIHERRLKFKPALFLCKDPSTRDQKEVWFAGNHCDVGGGFNYEEDGQQHLLSDIPLAWMIDEILALDEEPEAKLQLNKTSIEKHGHLQAGREASNDNHIIHPTLEQTMQSRRPHDFLAFFRGTTWYRTMMWWIIEILPFFTRLELEHGQWIPRYWPSNLGATRDLPEDAVVHRSVQKMYNAKVIDKMPKLGGDEPPVLQDPFRFLRAFAPWNLKKPPGIDLLKKSVKPKIRELHGARTWTWGD